jgi:Zn-dependent protease with chaperone function
MFENFLYYIIALLIYSTYAPVHPPDFSVFRCLTLFFGLTLLFFMITQIRFKRIERRIPRMTFKHSDRRFHATQTQQSIMALVVFAVDVYGLNTGALLRRFSLLTALPTMEALIFLSLFIGYLCVVWSLAYPSYKKIYGTGLSRGDYVRSSISFAVPVLLPWLFLSATADLIHLLPFAAPKRFLMSVEGQIAYFMFFLLVIAVIGPGIIQRFWGCRPLAFGTTRQRIESLCEKADMKFKNILVWPLFGGYTITAGVMGLIRRFRYILITPALMRHLEGEELDAVIAHEIGHIKKHHLLLYLFLFAGYLLLVFFSLDLIGFLIIYAQAAFSPLKMNAPAPATFTSIGFGLVMILLFFSYFRYVFGYFMRNFERQADLFAYSLTGNVRPLISTFEKITAATGQDPRKPNWHHFSIGQRMDYLKKCETDKSWIKRHDLKIKKSIAAYVAAILLAGWVGYGVHYGDMGERLNSRLLETVLEQQIQTNPGDPDLYQALGDLYYSKKEYAQTIAAYQQAIFLDPHHADALNNLAWLYATCADERFRRPQEALALAEQAAALSPKPHILDTLAEAFYVNGNMKAAIDAEKRALAAAKTDTAYYRKQLKRFKTALETPAETHSP